MQISNDSTWLKKNTPSLWKYVVVWQKEIRLYTKAMSQ